MGVVCTHCGWAFYADESPERAPVVEWLANSDGVCYADSIRVVHHMCQYADTIGNEMDHHQLWDRQFPLATLNKYIKLIHSMAWDDPALAIQTINEVMEYANKRN